MRTTSKLVSTHEDRRRRFEEPVHGVLSEYDHNQVLYPVAILDLLAGEAKAPDFWGAALDWDNVDPARVERELDRLDPYEADLIELTLAGCRQADLAHVFERTQAAISYRISRGIDNLKFLCQLPEFTEEDIRRDLGPWMNEKRVEILVLFHRTRNMSTVAKLLGMTAGTLRLQLFATLDYIEGEKRPDFDRYVIHFRAALKYNAKRRVPGEKRPIFPRTSIARSAMRRPSASTRQDG